MRVLLRSCFVGDPTDQPDLLLANYNELIQSPVPTHWEIPEDRTIWEALAAFVTAHGHVPGITSLRTTLEASGDFQAVDRLEAVVGRQSPALTRGNFLTQLKDVVQKAQKAGEHQILRTETIILHQRTEVQEPDQNGRPVKHWLHGAADSRQWAERARARLDLEWGTGTGGVSPWTRADQIEAIEWEWIWHGYIPRGELVLIEGPPSSGKTTMVRSLVAAVTTGKALPGEGGGWPPENVLWISSEEHPGSIIVPNLEYAGADLSRVVVWTNDEPWTISRIAELIKQVEEIKPAVIVLDALKDALGTYDDYKETEVRAVLAKLRAVAQDHRCTILGIRHWRKGAGAAGDKGAGSMAYLAVARAVLSVAIKGDERFLASVKQGWGNKGDTWQIEMEHQEDGEGRSRRKLARVRWVQVRPDITADDLSMGQPATSEDRSKLQEAQEFLLAELVNGSQPVKAIQAAAKAAGIAPHTLKRARESLCRSWSNGSHWSWELREALVPTTTAPDLDFDLNEEVEEVVVDVPEVVVDVPRSDAEIRAAITAFRAKPLVH